MIQSMTQGNATPLDRSIPPCRSLLPAAIALAALLAAGWTQGATGAPSPVLKAPGAIVIDGRDNDWGNFAPRQALRGADGEATVRLAYDPSAVYAFFEVRDASPLKNSAARFQEAIKGGDAVVLYFGKAASGDQRVLVARRDGKTEITAYRPESREKKPYVFASPVGEARFDWVAPLEKAAAAMRTAPGGYVVEVSLPWASLGYARPPATFPFDAEVIFSDPAGSTKAGAIWLHATDSPGQTIEDLPTEARLYPSSWGQARLTDKPDGVTDVAPLAATRGVPGVSIQLDLPRKGKVSLLVLDESGWIVRELLRAQPQAAGRLTVEWDGRDRYGEVLPPGRYTWKAALFDGMGAEFMGSVGASGRPPYRTPDGLGAIGGQHGIPASLAVDATGVYMSSGLEEGQPSIRKINPATGVALWKRSAGGFGAAMAIAASDQAACFINKKGDVLDFVRIDAQTGKDVAMSSGTSRLALTLNAESSIAGMAMVGTRAYATVPRENRIVVADLDAGRMLADIQIPSPQGLCQLDASHLLVCSGDSLIAVDLQKGTQTPWRGQLVAPRTVCRDAAGNVYVSELGDKQQITRLSPRGDVLTSIGRAGGKPATMKRYDPLAFENVTVLAMGADGALWACESSTCPKRFIKMTADGKWLEDFYGPVAYNAFGPDLGDFSTVFYNPGGNERGARLIQAHVDYDAYRASPADPVKGWRIEAIYDLTEAADPKQHNELMVSPAEGAYGHYIAFTATNGKRYLFRASKHNRAAAPAGAGLWLWENDTWVPAAFLTRDDKKHGLSWTDANADGMPQDDERFPGIPTREFAWMDADLVLHGFDGTLAPASVDARGVPHYKGGAYSPYLSADQPSYQGDWTFVSPTVDGESFHVANIGPGRAQSFWDRADESRVIKTKNGKVQWILGQQAAHPDLTEFSTMSSIAGVVDDILLVGNIEPAGYIALTTDGFTLGEVLVGEDGKRGKAGGNIINIENFTGLFAKDPRTQKRVLFAVSSGDDRIIEITGPGNLTRLEGTVQLDSARPLLRFDAAETEIPYQSWYGNSPRNLAVDAIPWEWTPEASGLPIFQDNVLIGDVRLRRDAGAIYILANVLDPTPLEAGEGIEIVLATASGEYPARFFLSAQRDSKGQWVGLATLHKGDAAVDAKRVECAAALRWRNLGYRIEAAIPLDLLPELSRATRQTFGRGGVDPKTGQKNQMIQRSEVLPDLAGPVQLQVGIARKSNDIIGMATWPAAGMATATAP